MNPANLAKCKNITQEMIESPLTAVFAHAVIEDLPNYLNVIKKPIDFEKIRENLSNNVYKTVSQWNDDMLLVFTNAMRYHDPEVIWHKIAEYDLSIYRKKVESFISKDSQRYYDKMNKAMRELTKLIQESPIPQGTDPLVIDCERRAEHAPMPNGNSQTVFDLDEKLSKLMQNKKYKEEIFAILKDTNPDLDANSNDIEVDIDSLPSQTINSLIYYTQSRI